MRKFAALSTLSLAILCAAPAAALADSDDVYGSDDYAATTYTPPAYSAPTYSAPIAYAPSGGTVACILARESNNGATSSNVAQFTESTWLAYGGGQYASSPGAASYSQQVAMVNHVLATPGGISNWSPYDHC